jgi:hypothetical protein
VLGAEAETGSEAANLAAWGGESGLGVVRDSGGLGVAEFPESGPS